MLIQTMAILFLNMVKKLTLVANRLLIFDGLKEHATVVQTDTSARYIININYLT